MTAGAAASGPGTWPSPLPVDSLSVWQAAVALPEQVSAALAGSTAALAAGALDPVIGTGPVTGVAVLGAGTAGLAGDLLAAVAAPASPVPVLVVRDGGLPACVGPGWLVLAVSWSGETAETLAAAELADRAGARVVVVTGGGALARLAGERGWPVLPVAGGLPAGRAALGALAVPPLVVLERVGLLAGVTTRLAAAVEHVARRRDVLCAPGGLPPEIARRIGRTVPLVHGSTGVAGVAARRWKAQVNENAKSPAFWSLQPELCHDEVAGWGLGGDVTRQVLTLVTLRHGGEDPAVARRFALVEELMLEVVGDVVPVRSEAGEELARFFELALCGDLVSLHLAGREGVDPGPVPVADELAAAAVAAGPAAPGTPP